MSLTLTRRRAVAGTLAALTAWAAPTPKAAATTWQPGPMLDPADYLTADGATDDAQGLRDYAAACVAAGQPVRLPAGRVIGVRSRVNLPACTVQANGATIRGLTATGDFLLTLTGGTTVEGHLNVVVAAGANVRGVAISGARVSVDSLDVSAPAPGAGAGNLNCQALLISGTSRVRIGALDVTNFDYPLKAANAGQTTITTLNLTRYVRALYLTNVVHFHVTQGLIQGASPNAGPDAGHNGVLIDATATDATTDVYLSDLTVEDAGEHGFRIGGQYRVRRVTFATTRAVNVGGCGYKVLGTASQRHEGITFLHPYVEDAGQTDENADGIMVQYAKRVKITEPVVLAAAKQFSATRGIELQAVEQVTVVEPVITGTRVACYAVRQALGDSTNVRLIGGLLTATSGDGILLDYTGRRFRRVSVEDHPQVDVSGGGVSVRIVNDGGGAVIGGSWITWQSVMGGVQADGLLAGYFCDARATLVGSPAFRNGSTWLDNSSGARWVRQPGAWVAA